MAPLVASMRSLAAMLQLASTTKRIRLPVRRTRTLRCRSPLRRWRARSFGRLLLALALVGRGGAQRGVERDVLRLVAGRARLDVAAPLAIGAGVGAFAGALARHLVERSVEPLGIERVADLDRLAGAFVVSGR